MQDLGLLLNSIKFRVCLFFRETLCVKVFTVEVLGEGDRGLVLGVLGLFWPWLSWEFLELKDIPLRSLGRDVLCSE